MQVAHQHDVSLRMVICILHDNRYYVVLFTDEATFGHDGICNLHNHHLWATDYPHRLVEMSHQQRFSINVWAGNIGDHLLGPVLLPQCLSGETYLAFLQNTLPPLLENVPLAI